MDAISIAAVVGLLAVALGKKAPPDGDGNVDGVSPTTSLPPPDPGPGGATEVIDDTGTPVLSTNDGAGPILVEGTGSSGKHPTVPGGSCACVKAPCACDGPVLSGGKGTGVVVQKPLPTSSSPSTSPSGPATGPLPTTGPGYDGSGINPTKPIPATKPATTTTKPNTTTKPGTTVNSPPIIAKPGTTGSKVYSSLSKSTPKDVARALERLGPNLGTIW